MSAPMALGHGGSNRKLRSSIYESIHDCRSRCARCYPPSITSIPASSSASLPRGSFPTRTVSKALSRATIRETLAPESFGNPVKREEKVRCREHPPTVGYWSVEYLRPSRGGFDLVRRLE